MSRSPLTIEYLPVDEILPASRNARVHSRRQKALLADSIRRFGMVTPVGIGPDNRLIYGHARVEAAKLAGLERVPVVRLDHLSPGEQRAYLLADNRLALESGWNRELLALELQELQALDFDLPALGFSLPEIDGLYGCPSRYLSQAAIFRQLSSMWRGAAGPRLNEVEVHFANARGSNWER